jgi:predicted short-subunit dehydrogenase-like oxidoreductase (DUF2520 family)
MTLRIAIVGPGRVGRALGRQFVRAGAALLGFVGRATTAGHAAARAGAAFAGGGRALTYEELARAHVVVFAVGDPELQEAIGRAAAAGARRCALWLHTSGRHDLAVFDAVADAGIRRGALHPLLPFADADAAAAALPGALALATAGPRAERLLQRVASLLGLRPIAAGAQDRVLYHAACALAANGAASLFGAAERLLAAAGGLGEADRRAIVRQLAATSVAACGTRGPAAALSGPVRRGDAATIQEHLVAIAREAPGEQDLYRAAMAGALVLAREAGLAAAAARQLASLLGLDR